MVDLSEPFVAAAFVALVGLVGTLAAVGQRRRHAEAVEREAKWSRLAAGQSELRAEVRSMHADMGGQARQLRIVEAKLLECVREKDALLAERNRLARWIDRFGEAGGAGEIG